MATKAKAKNGKPKAKAAKKSLALITCRMIQAGKGNAEIEKALLKAGAKKGSPKNTVPWYRAQMKKGRVKVVDGKLKWRASA